MLTDAILALRTEIDGLRVGLTQQCRSAQGVTAHPHLVVPTLDSKLCSCMAIGVSLPDSTLTRLSFAAYRSSLSVCGQRDSSDGVLGSAMTAGAYFDWQLVRLHR